MGSKPSVMMIKPPIGFLLGLNPLIPKLVAEVLTNERVCAKCRGRQESSAARNLALSKLARIVRHSLGLKSVKDSVRPGIGGDFSRAQIASSSAGRSNRPPGRDRCVSSDDGALNARYGGEALALARDNYGIRPEIRAAFLSFL
jgi:hypothetical protein